MGFSKNPLLDP